MFILSPEGRSWLNKLVNVLQEAKEQVPYVCFHDIVITDPADDRIPFAEDPRNQMICLHKEIVRLMGSIVNVIAIFDEQEAPDVVYGPDDESIIREWSAREILEADETNPQM